MRFIGIDPGKSGAIATICDYADPEWIKCSETDHDLSDWLGMFGDTDKVAAIERVRSSPQQGVVSAFTFGRSYGFLIGLLTAHRIPYREVTPQTWQKTMQCLTQGDKNVSKAAAQRLWPNLKITHATADALLLAEYCRRTWK